MLHQFLSNSSLHELLNQIDFEIADKVRQAGCPHCGGRLDRADYPRSPLGLIPALRAYYQQRLSFCCAKCRKRTTPPSVRFFGRRWFPAPLLILISALMMGATGRRRSAIKQRLGIAVSERTWKRWRAWWQERFTTTSFWKKEKGLIPLHARDGPFPRALLDIYAGQLKERMATLLRFLAPMTAGIFRAV